jgi:hypothetical protein
MLVKLNIQQHLKVWRYISERNKFLFGESMFKKIMLSVTILSIGTTFLSSCKPVSDTNGNVSIEDMMPLLLGKAQTIATTPGWLRVTEDITYDIDAENIDTLDNGTIIPLEQNKITWYHINEQGKVFENVIYLNSVDGEELQLSVYWGNAIMNLTTRVSIAQDPYSLGALDYNFSPEMQDYIDRTNKSPGFEIKEVDGREAAIVTLDETLDTPLTTDYYAEQVYGIRTVAYFDMVTGLLFQLDRYRIFKDNTERLYFQTKITVESNIEPTQDVLFLLSGMN